MARTLSDRTKTDDIVIVDADVHVHDAPAALAPYCAAPWRSSLAELARTPARYLDIPGFAPSLKLDPPIPGGHPGRVVRAAATGWRYAWVREGEIVTCPWHGLEFDITGQRLARPKARLRTFSISVETAW